MSSDQKPDKKSNKLTKKQAIFVREYLTDFNGTRAAIAAGYSKKGAEVAASRLLRDVKVAAAIDGETSERCERLGVKADEIIAELAKLGFANMLDYITIQNGEAYINFSALTRVQAAAIQEITSETYQEPIGAGETAEEGEKKRTAGEPIVRLTRTVKRTKFKLFDKRGSLELLGRHLKLFTDKLDVNANLNGSLKLDPTQRVERLGQLLSRAIKGGSRKSK
jgi:phage terminase small subunit